MMKRYMTLGIYAKDASPIWVKEIAIERREK